MQIVKLWAKMWCASNIRLALTVLFACNCQHSEEAIQGRQKSITNHLLISGVENMMSTRDLPLLSLKGANIQLKMAFHRELISQCKERKPKRQFKDDVVVKTEISKV